MLSCLQDHRCVIIAGSCCQIGCIWCGIAWAIRADALPRRNDIMSNGVAILCGIGASQSRRLWWIDPVGGILVSLYIIYSWLLICKGQVWPHTTCVAAA